MRSASIPRNDPGGRLFSPLQLTVVIALHAAIWAALMASDARAVLPRTETLMVRMIAPEPLPVAPPTPTGNARPAAAKPAAARAPVPPRPLLATTAATTGTTSRASAPEPEPVVAAAIAPAATSATIASVTAAVAPPAPLIEPRFDANYLDNPAPAYPAISRRLGEEGKVVLRVFVQADGRPVTVELNAGSGSPRLDEAALDAVRRWKFVPARRGAEAVGAWVLVPIAFHLKG